MTTASPPNQRAYLSASTAPMDRSKKRVLAMARAQEEEDIMCGIAAYYARCMGNAG